MLEGRGVGLVFGCGSIYTMESVFLFYVILERRIVLHTNNIQPISTQVM